MAGDVREGGWPRCCGRRAPSRQRGAGCSSPQQSPGVWVTITPVLRVRRVRLGKVGERAHSHPAGLGWWTCHPEPIENGTRPKNVFGAPGLAALACAALRLVLPVFPPPPHAERRHRSRRTRTAGRCVSVSVSGGDEMGGSGRDALSAPAGVFPCSWKAAPNRCPHAGFRTAGVLFRGGAGGLFQARGQCRWLGFGS